MYLATGVRFVPGLERLQHCPEVALRNILALASAKDGFAADERELTSFLRGAISYSNNEVQNYMSTK